MFPGRTCLGKHTTAHCHTALENHNTHISCPHQAARELYTVPCVKEVTNTTDF